MKIIKKPEASSWGEICKRATVNRQELTTMVSQIFDEIEKTGDEGVKRYTHFFDKVDLDSFEVTIDVIGNSENQISKELKSAIQLAYNNIYAFHNSQKLENKVIETTKGVQCWREDRPIEKVGIYIPGGTAPLFSTVLMLGIPAQIAGCKEVVLCTPPNKEGKIDPAILYTAKLIGVTKVMAVGGIQAIGALTFGTDTIPKVDKIFGPGNQFVTAAKQYALNYGVAIDMPAGPSEVLVIADESSNAEFVAADLLSQAEHGSDSQVFLVADNEKIIEEVNRQIELQLNDLSRKEIAKKALQNSRAILLNNLDDCMKFSNAYAPEHLIIAVDNAEKLINQVESAGSVFLGQYSCESAGDYASGTNHTLPTNNYARNYSGVSLDSFTKKITFQSLTAEGIKNIGPAIEYMAEAEQLQAHKNAVTVRLKSLQNG